MPCGLALPKKSEQPKAKIQPKVSPITLNICMLIFANYYQANNKRKYANLYPELT